MDDSRRAEFRARPFPPPSNEACCRSPTAQASFLAKGLQFTCLRVIPTAAAQADFVLGRDLGLFYQIASETPELGKAREATGNRLVPNMTVVKCDFIGYDSNGDPAYLSRTHRSRSPPGACRRTTTATTSG